MEVGIGLGIEANIAVASVRFNLVIKLNIYIPCIDGVDARDISGSIAVI